MAQKGSVTHHIDLPVDAIGIIVGKNRYKIAHMAKESGAKLVLDKQPRPEDEGLKRLNFQGSSQQVQHAYVLVLEVLAQWCDMDPENPDKIPQALRQDVHRALNSKNAQPNGTPTPPNGQPAPPAPTQTPPAKPAAPAPLAAAPAGGEPPSAAPAQPAPGGAAEPQGTVTLELPVASMGFVIGPDGESLPELEQRTGARVVPVRRGQSDFALEITGTREAIQRAQHLLMQIMSMWNAEMQRQHMLHMQQFHQQQQFLAQQAQQQLQQQPPPPNGAPNGAPAQAQPAPAPAPTAGAPPAEQPAAAGETPAAKGGKGKGGDKAAAAVLRLEVSVPAGAAGMIVGKKAAQIKRFRVECGLKVAVKQDGAEGAPTKVVTLEGPRAAVDKGLVMLSDTLGAWASAVESEPRKQPAAWLQYLTAQLPPPGAPPAPKASPKAAPTTGILRPPAPAPAAPAAAAAEPQATAPKRGKGAGHVRLEIEVPASSVGAILGKQGRTVQGIKSKTGASLSLAHDPLPHDAAKRALTIDGGRDSVQAARGMVLDIVGTWLATEGGAGGEVSQQQRREARERAEKGANDKLTVIKEPAPKPAPAASQEHKPPAAEQSERVGGGGGEEKVEMLVSVAAAAMIIGRKGSMLKLLMSKSGAKVTLEQKEMADGRKRVCIEGAATAVAKAQKTVRDILSQCDDAKYEEAAKKKAEEEDGKRSAESAESARKQQVAQAEKERRRQEKEEEDRAAAKKALVEKKLQEKKEKALAESEAKKKLSAKMAANPFEFLHGDSDGAASDDEDGSEEEVHNPPPKKGGEVSKKKKKKSKGGAKANGPTGSPEGGGGGGAPQETKRRASAEEGGSSESEEEYDEDHPNLIGLDRMLHSIHKELDQVEGTMDFTSGGSPVPRRAPSDAQEPAATEQEEHEEEQASRVAVGSVTRRGMMHANEDRMALLEFADLLSEGTRARLLEKSTTGSIPLFAVFDGHGGDKAAEESSKQLPRHIANAVEEAAQNHGDGDMDVGGVIAAAMSVGFERMEEGLKKLYDEKGEKSGTCAVCVIMHDKDGQGVLTIANLGDCRAVIGRGTRTHLTCVPLTIDHRANASEERNRIEKAGGFVQDKRALGDLIPSRTLGDFKTKAKCPGAVIAEPDVTSHELLAEDCLLLLASDGLWDDLKSARVMDIASKARTPDKCVQEIAKAVIKKYGAKNTKPNDDLTVLACYFNHLHCP